MKLKEKLLERKQSVKIRMQDNESNIQIHNYYTGVYDTLEFVLDEIQKEIDEKEKLKEMKQKEESDKLLARLMENVKNLGTTEEG